MNLLQGMKITADYPAGLKPWDGRFHPIDPAADVVILELSPSGRAARETAFAFSLDLAFRVLGVRERVLVSPKRGRWAPGAVPFIGTPWVSTMVFKAAVEQHLARIADMQKRLQADAERRTP